jgi:hypothetical protein
MLGALFGLSSLFSAYAAGVAGAAIALKLGPALAMLLRMYGGDTEPTQPEPFYPWGLAAALAVLPIPLALRKRWTLAGIAAAPFAVVPFVWALMEMFAAAAGTPE